MVLTLLAGIVNYIVISPILFTFFAVVLSVSSLGKAFGLRRLYVNFLLRIFEYGRVNIERVKGRSSDDEDEESLIEHESDGDSEQEKEKLETLANGDATPVIADQLANGKPKGENGHLKNGAAAAATANGQAKNGTSLISKNAIKLAPDMSDHADPKDKNADELTAENFDFKLENCLDYMNAGMEAIIEDDVTSRFEAEEIKNWNLLTRTNRRYEFITWRLTVIWVIGFFIRYFILMPIRVFICFCGVMWAVVSFGIVGLVPVYRWRRKLNDWAFKVTFILISRSLSADMEFHNPQYRPRNCGFCVANHTSPIDIAILSTDCTYSLIGQSHGGFLGVLQKALSRASPHIWFERAEAKDRHAVAGRLKEHVSNPKNPPILIFPEGTCINNTSVMQFKKGSFEVGGVIYPVAIKYDARFGDAFWNSAKYSMMQHLFLMMTSWAIVCDVWYLPPMYQQEGETAIAFANRVKSVIAKQGGLVDLMWDGQLKRQKARKEWKEQQQEEFTKRLKGE